MGAMVGQLFAYVSVEGTPFLMRVMNVYRWVVQVVLQPEQAKGFVLQRIVSSNGHLVGSWGANAWSETMNCWQRISFVCQ
jgi:predicted glycosyl hydrolase (DUF1957 family)